MANTATLLVTYEWTRNKQAITSAIDWDVQGKIKSVNTGLIAWDPMNKKIIGLTAHADGGITHYEYQGQGNKLVIPGHGADANGVRTVTTFESSDISKDSFTVRIIKRVAGDEDTTPPSGPGLKVTRVKE